jgi:hypothetical protein
MERAGEAIRESFELYLPVSVSNIEIFVNSRVSTFYYRRSLAFSKESEKVLMLNESNKLFWYNIEDMLQLLKIICW